MVAGFHNGCLIIMLPPARPDESMDDGRDPGFSDLVLGLLCTSEAEHSMPEERRRAGMPGLTYPLGRAGRHAQCIPSRSAPSVPTKSGFLSDKTRQSLIFHAASGGPTTIDGRCTCLSWSVRPDTCLLFPTRLVTILNYKCLTALMYIFTATNLQNALGLS